ncbi:MAG: hypothetical protein QWI36_04915 [Wolbachia endosymbiont of Tyrophagus putrescentiae]|nr:hypothetical protein [Wolbachia endosymbiont of Tyrophagus putrescentiae]
MLVALLACVFVYNKKVYSRNQDTIDRIHFINSQIIEAHEREVVFNKYLDLWQRVSSSSLHSSKYISNLSLELKRLYRKYSMLSPEMSISVPEEVEIQHIGKHTKVIKSKVTLSFSAVSDKHIFLFLQSIPSLPGYVMIKSLVLNKQRNIDTVIMHQISNGDMVEVVRANIVFDWYTVLKNED